MIHGWVALGASDLKQLEPSRNRQHQDFLVRVILKTAKTVKMGTLVPPKPSKAEAWNTGAKNMVKIIQNASVKSDRQNRQNRKNRQNRQNQNRQNGHPQTRSKIATAKTVKTGIPTQHHQGKNDPQMGMASLPMVGWTLLRF